MHEVVTRPSRASQGLGGPTRPNPLVSRQRMVKMPAPLTTTRMAQAIRNAIARRGGCGLRVYQMISQARADGAAAAHRMYKGGKPVLSMMTPREWYQAIATRYAPKNGT